MKNSKVLLSAPVSDRHFYCFKDYLQNLDKIEGEKDVHLIDTTLDGTKCLDFAQSKGISIEHHEWSGDFQHPVQMLADVREKLRVMAIRKKYDFLFFVDSDVFPKPTYLNRALRFGKHYVAPVVHIYHNPCTVPCVLRSGDIDLKKGLDYYSWEEVRGCNGKLIKVYGAALGCSLLSRKLFKSVVFRTHPSFIQGEDLWFFSEANDKGFELWCDTGTFVEHRNTSWDSLLRVHPLQRVWVAGGYEDARKAVIVRRH